MPKKGCLGCSFPLTVGILVVFLALFIVGLISGALGQAIIGETSIGSAVAIEKPHIQLPAEPIFHIGGFAVTNTLLTSWISMLVLVLLCWAITHRIKIIPSRLQSLLESALEWMLNFCVEVAGEKNGRRFFPLITTIFLFVLINAWMSLIPGYSSWNRTLEEEVLTGISANPGMAIGHAKIIADVKDIEEIHKDDILVFDIYTPEYEPAFDHCAAVILDEEDINGNAAALCRENDIPCVAATHEATTHLENDQNVRVDGSSGVISEIEKIHILRGANTDINVPLALALVSFVFVIYNGVRALGHHFFKVWFNFGRFFQGHKKLFTGKVKAGFGDIGMGVIDIFVGFLELLSYLFRNISFTFRLFGNMTGGEALILMMMFLVPWVLAIPFYGLELLVGTIQALVFAGLTLVFATVAITPHEAEEA